MELHFTIFTTKYGGNPATSHLSLVFCYKYRKAIDLGKEGGATFYDICNEIWRESSHESLKSGIENTSGEIETGEND